MSEGDIGNIENNPSGLRFRLIAELGNKLGFRSVNLINPENLDIPNGKPVILTATHTDDRTIPAIMGALASKMDLRVPYISALDKEQPTATIMTVMGKKHFIPLDYTKTETGEWQAQKFNPSNLQPAIEALKEAKKPTVLIAAHNPTYDYILPKRGAYGAEWLAHQSGAVIIPVAVNTHEPELVGKPKAGRRQSLTKSLHRPNIDIIFGKPITLSALPDDPNNLTPGNIEQLHNESDYIMQRLAEMLPPEQRGSWATRQAISLESSGTKSPLEELTARATEK